MPSAALGPVLTCVQFDADGVTCTATAWVQPPPPVFPALTVDQGAEIGGAIFFALVAIAASKLPRRA